MYIKDMEYKNTKNILQSVVVTIIYNDFNYLNEYLHL